MEPDLKVLEDKLAQFIELCNRLKGENHQLRQELAQAQSDTHLLKDSVTEAENRLRFIIQKLPEGTS